MFRRIPAWVWLLSPALLFVLAMAVFPLGYSFLLSLREWKLARMDLPGAWVGLQNYVLLLTDDPEFMDSVKVTALFLVWDVLATLLLADLSLSTDAYATSDARAAGLTPFAVTIDRDANSYMPLLFGSQGFALVRKPAELVARLTQVWSTLARAPG